ncbi:MAG: LysR family transcriptional regulator [Pseudomonadota bacterium]
MSESNISELRRLDGTLLLVFLSLMRHRKAARVADELSMTPSTVSHALGRLRDIFGDPLFLRRSHGLDPTAVAVGLEPQVQRALDTLRGALTASQRFDPAGSTDVVRLTAFDVDLVTVVPDLVSRLAQAAPGMRLVTRAEGRRAALEALETAQVDLALGYFPDLRDGFHARALYLQEFAVVCQKTLLGQTDTCTLDAYLSHRHVIVAPGGDLRGIVDTTLGDMGLTREVVLSVPLFFPALAAVAKAPLLTTLPRRFALEFADRLGLAVYTPPIALRSFTVSSVRHLRDLNNPMINWIEDQIVAGR